MVESNASGRARGSDLRYNLEISLEEAYSGKREDVRFLGRHLNVNIPAGIEDGTRIRLAGEGETGSPPGDLYIFVSVQQHNFFKRQGADLFCEVPITMQMAIYGGSVDLALINGQVLSVKIPEATQSGTRIRLAAKGMPVLRSQEVGDLYMSVIVETPDPRTMKSKKAEEYGERVWKIRHGPEATLVRGEVKSVGATPARASPTKTGPILVISYRRSDTRWIAGRILDRLEAHFGKDSVFIDIEDMPPGLDFRDHISLILEQCDVLLALIGPLWAGTVDDGPSKIFDEADWVRIEIETALQKGIPVIPILIERSPMPRPEDLPTTLKPFAFRQAVEIDPGRDFNVHVERLLRGIDRLLGRTVADEKQKEIGSSKKPKPKGR
jgi:hypothetical protein